MPRFFEKTTLGEFKERVKYLFEEPPKGDRPFPYSLPKHIENDLKKVEFDFENYEVRDGDPLHYDPKYDSGGFCEYPCGFEVLKNGMPCLFVNAGGDWEYPICFVLYWDGRKIRAYIPEEGNVYNKEKKSAYGNNDGEEPEDSELPDGDAEAIRYDVMARIKQKV